ncbi:MAG TPA: thiamine ABC transporter substrate-binding protein, partial [Beutenbergiaceae bacterium]|nr:thiamine ABC transporter substrate-binding protein [Beutenbergiaceae bacterium]
EPETFDDLLKEEYEGLTVVTNPAQSSPGLAFLLATIANFDADWENYWADLIDNDLKIVDSWSDAYYTDFSANEGSRPIALSYSTSPAFTLDDDGDSTTGSMLDTCFRQIEYAGVLTGAENPEGAQAFIDFLLSDEVQAAIPESLYMYPVTGVDLPEDWVAHAPLADDPHQVDPADIEANLDDWLRIWQDDVIG